MKASIFLKSVRWRTKLRFLWNTWFRPNLVVEERERKALNRELKGHWPDRQLHAYELVHEQWIPDEELRNGESDKRFVVFIDHELAIDWITNEDLTAGGGKLVAAAEAVGARRFKHLPKEQVLELKRLVGQAIVCAIQGNSKESSSLAQQASDHLKARTVERSRYWSLMSSHLHLGIVVVLAIWTWPRLCEALDSSNGVGFGLLGGFLGAYLSLMQTAGRGSWDSASGPWIHLVEAFTKLTAGVVLGGVAIAFSRSVHAPQSLKALTSDSYSVFVFGFCAGFVERLIPRMISQYSTNLTQVRDEP